MARPRVFISSTFYDLKQIRSDLDNFIEGLGYEPVRNEEGDIPYGKEDALEEYCYEEIKSVDILISVIGGRFGSESTRTNHYSISQIELRTALKENKQIYIFVEKNVLSEYETYCINKESTDIKYRYVDDKRIYQFIEEVKNLNSNNNIKSFETALDITKYLKEQLAGLFQSFLEKQTRVKEVSLIQNLEKTAHTLNTLVNFLSDENKEQAEEINKILMINHPLVEAIKKDLEIPYNFYIEGLDDLNSLLLARNFRFVDDNTEPTYEWKNEKRGKVKHILISDSLFEDGKLKYIKKTDWEDHLYQYLTCDINQNDNNDDFPF